MSKLSVSLNEENSRLAGELARQTGKSPDQLVNDVVAEYLGRAEVDEQQRFERWRAAMLKIEGMWEDRTDLPDFDELRKSWDRNPWGE